MKCKNGHEVPEEKKFCGTCGSPPEQELRKCEHCKGNAILKSHAFCPDCGKPAASEDELFKSQLDLLGDYTASRAAFTKDHGTVPVIDPDTIDLAAVNELLKAHTVEEGGEKVLEVGPIVVELIKSIHGLGQARQADAVHVGAHFDRIEDGLLRVCGALGVIGQRVASFEELVKAQGGQTRGRKTILHTVERPVPGRGTGEGGEDPDDVPALEIRKALNVSLKAKPELLSIPDCAQLTEATNSGWSLKAMIEHSPALGEIARRVLKQATEAAA